MIIPEEFKEKLIEDMIEMARNNPDKQCYITPSRYGIAKTNESRDKFKEYLLTLDIVKKVNTNGKDSLIVTLNN